MMYQLVLILYLADLSIQQTITISKYYGQSKTDCKEALLKDVDQVVMRSTLYISGHTDELFDVFYELKMKNASYDKFCHLDLTACKNNNNNICYCLENSTSEVYNVVISLPADVRFSQAMVRGFIKFKDWQLNGNEEMLPIIYTPSFQDIVLNINNINIDVNNCNTDINDSTTIIIFRKMDTFSLPYALEIVNNSSQDILKNGTDSISYILNEDGKADLKFTHKACKLEENALSFSCSINTVNSWSKYKSNSKYQRCFSSDCYTTYQYLTFILGTIILVLLFWIVFQCVFSKRKINALKQQLKQKIQETQQKAETSVMITDSNTELYG